MDGHCAEPKKQGASRQKKKNKVRPENGALFKSFQKAPFLVHLG
jgi:hypothetical protein